MDILGSEFLLNQLLSGALASLFRVKVNKALTDGAVFEKGCDGLDFLLIIGTLHVVLIDTFQGDVFIFD